MADINRAAIPINNRNIIQPTKEHRPEQLPFDFQNTSRIKQTLSESGLSGQNNVLREDGSASGFYQILRDPDIASSFLKNIFLLQEIVGILPLNNSAQTEEIQALLKNLVLSPDEIAGELMRQEDISTMFRGGFFDMLRDLNEKNPSPDFAKAVSNLLKAINNENSKESIFDSITNNLEYLKEQLSPSTVLSEKINVITERLQQFRNMTNDLQGKHETQEILNEFATLKNDIFAVFKSIERSILYNEDLSKNISMITYNLSRLNISDEAISETFSRLLTLIRDDADKENLTNSLLKFFDNDIQAEPSKTMTALTEILEKQAENPDLKTINSDGVDKIIHSLLSSPCNFTPLLHYVILTGYEDLRASAEIWINPDGEDDLAHKEADTKCTHILSVFEIQEIGKFEIELFVQDKSIDLLIFCPEQYTDFFKDTVKDMRKLLRNTVYKVKNINVDAMRAQRSLIDVFKSLSQRRQGVNVKI